MVVNEDDGRRVAQVCEQLVELREIADACDERPRLERIIEALRTDTAAALAELDELLRRCGVPAGIGRGIGGLPGVGAGHPVEEVYVCPERLCARVVLPHRVPEAPVCLLRHGQRLSLMRL